LANLIKQRQNIHQQLRQNEERIASLEQQIKAAQKLASLGTMACLIAHEFNNILLLITDYAQLALDNDDDLPLMRKALDKTVKHGNRAASMIRSMLGLVTNQPDTCESVKLAPLVTECFNCLARDLAKDRITVNLNITDDITVYAVPSQLQQVLLNLIINARQAMLDHGGTLNITAYNQDDGSVGIDVTDSGCGIEPDLLDTIFDPFVSTKTDAKRPDQRGTGLGLTLCKEIIAAHHGNISVTSRPGRGSTFSLNLPPKQKASPKLPH